jgi:Tol biopolymer transport system component
MQIEQDRPPRKYKEKRKRLPGSPLTSCLTVLAVSAIVIGSMLILGTPRTPAPVMTTTPMESTRPFRPSATQTTMYSLTEVAASPLPTITVRARTLSSSSLTGKIAFISLQDQFTYVVDADGSNLHMILPNLAHQNVHPWNTPVWSPDGKRVAFTALPASGNQSEGIYVMEVDNSNLIRLTSDDDYYPSWSPDGKRIALQRRLSDGDWIFLMNADGTNRVKLTRGEYPSWSPNGKRIVFQLNVSPTNIKVIDVDGSNEVTLTTYGTNGWPAWSPDGRYIAFSSYHLPDGGFRIHRMNADGSNRIELNTIDGQFVSWSPDSKHLTFLSYGNRWNEIYILDVDGANGRLLTNSALAPRWIP